MTPIRNAKCYEVRYAAVAAGGTPGPWQSGVRLTNSRSMPLNGLTPGVNYTNQARAIGGTTRDSDWSDPVSHVRI